MSVLNLMLRPNIRNRTFDWMGERYSSIIDEEHFLGHGLIGTPWNKYTRPLKIHPVDGELLFEIAIPGFEKEDISVSLMDNILTICGKKENQRENEIVVNPVYHKKELSPQPFELRYRLRKSLDVHHVRAEYTNDVLRLFFTSTKESEQTLINVN
jgi:HSP20 family protein